MGHADGEESTVSTVFSPARPHLITPLRLDHLTGGLMMLETAVGCEQLTTDPTENFRREINEPEKRRVSGNSLPMKAFGVFSGKTGSKVINDGPSQIHS